MKQSRICERVQSGNFACRREGGRGRSCACWDAQSFAESEPVRSAAHVCCVSMGHVFSALLPRLSALCLQVTTVAAGASNKPGSHVDGALL